MANSGEELDAVHWRFVEVELGSETYQQELALRDLLLRRPLGFEISQEDIEQDADHLHFGIVANEPSELIACVIAVDLGNHHAKLRQMAVAEPKQRSGIGTSLIRQTEATLKSRGFRSLELNAREPAIGFYERLGYLPKGDRFIEVTIEHQKMVREL